MKKTAIGLLSIAMLSSTLSATSLFFDRGIESDFQRLNQYANRVLASHTMHPSLQYQSYPKLNMSENKEQYTLQFELAGINKSDLKLSVEQGNILVLEGEKKQETKEKNSTYFREEISYGKFKRALQLPKDANQAKLETKYQDGILTITIPKKEIQKPTSKIITIN